MNPTLRRLVILHRAALGQWKARSAQRRAVYGRLGDFDYALEAHISRRMAFLDTAMDRIQRAMAAL